MNKQIDKFTKLEVLPAVFDEILACYEHYSPQNHTALLKNAPSRRWWVKRGPPLPELQQQFETEEKTVAKLG
jgi:hypothetical protein